MDSIAVTRDFRRMQGALMIKSYQESGLRLKEWLEQNKISKYKYYYWRRKFRDNQLDDFIARTVPDVHFTEVISPEPVDQPKPIECGNTVAAMISISGIEIRINDAASAAFIRKLIEAADHVK